MVLERTVRKVWLRRPTKRQLSIRRRSYGITPNDQVRVARTLHLMHVCAKAINILPQLAHFSEAVKKTKKVKLLKIFAICAMKWRRLVRVPEELSHPLSKVRRTYARIDHFTDEVVPGLFRFDNKAQLRQLFQAFEFPLSFRHPDGHVFGGEEVFLAGLFRLHAPNIQGDVSWRTVFGYDQPQTSRATSLFFLFMVNNWAYLLQDHMEFWLPYMPIFAEKIRAKLASYGCDFEPGEFRVFSFIDNTMNATCRPGGGPRRGGVDAPRNDPLIQRAWYNGWKKLHGMKWQTIDMPNGMNFHGEHLLSSLFDFPFLPLILIHYPASPPLPLPCNPFPSSLPSLLFHFSISLGAGKP